MEMLQGVWKQHLRPRAVVGYDVKIFLPSPPNYVTRSSGGWFGRQATTLRKTQDKLQHSLKLSSSALCWRKHVQHSLAIKIDNCKP